MKILEYIDNETLVMIVIDLLNADPEAMIGLIDYLTVDCKLNIPLVIKELSQFIQVNQIYLQTTLHCIGVNKFNFNQILQ